MHKICYGTESIEFTVDGRARKTLALHVYPDRHVEVVAPDDAKLDTVMKKVHKRAVWVLRKQKEFSRIQPPQPKAKYQSGETYILKLSRSGNSFPEEIDIFNPDSFGLKLIASLIENLKDEMNLRSCPAQGRRFLPIYFYKIFIHFFR